MSLSLEQIDAYIDALCVNAEQLIKEAKALHAMDAYARAFALAHFAREELSKAAMLSAAAARLLAQHPVDWKRLQKRMRDHQAKLRLEVVEIAFLLKGAGNAAWANELLSGLAVDVASARNDLKNDALYVRLDGRKVSLPSETRTSYQAMRTIELAEMRFDDFAFRRRKLGPYSGRAIGSATFANPDQVEFDEATLDFMAKATLHISNLAEAEAAAAKTGVQSGKALGSAEPFEN